MKLRKDLTGLRVGRLKVLRVAESTASGTRWLCRCVCGAKTIVYSFNLIGTNTVSSCGCLRQEMVAAANFKHGDNTRTKRAPEYNIWSAMLDRCNNRKNPQYKDYGGRGIRVDPRWFNYKHFLEDMGRRPSPELTLDRRHNDRGYSKKNCRWATRKEQSANRRISK